MSDQKIVQDARVFISTIERLKNSSKRWPEVFSELSDDKKEVYASTLARVKIEGTWYLVHCCARASVPLAVDVPSGMYSALLSLIRIVHEVQNLYKVTGIKELEEVDSDQSEESERLEKIRPFKIAK